VDDTLAWHQANIEFPGWDRAEHVAAARLYPRLEETAPASLYWFMRKQPCWRLRYRAGRDGASRTGHALDALTEAGHIAGWTPVIYEPEVHAFGGPEAMGAVHRLFHEDSREILAYLHTRPEDTRRREYSLMLCSIMMRAARQDFFEQGDVWARVAACRPAPAEHAAGPGLPGLVRRFLATDAESRMHEDAALGSCARWAAAYSAAGEELGKLAAAGRLHRGLRDVLSHCVIFAWNRLGLPYATQCTLASAAKAAVFGPDPAPCAR
jgi:thiopeptide-type bacteriocin biosynthesis protein